MCKEDLINLKKELEKNCISLTKFLINYCGIYNAEIHNIKISHRDIKELMPHVSRISFEKLLEDKTHLYVGNIVAVKDSFGNVAPYVNPMLQISEPLQIDCEKTKEENVIEEIIIDENLSVYELVKLCRYFKTHNRLREYRIAHKLLEKEKDTRVKQYKKRKDNLIMEGRYRYEEY